MAILLSAAALWFIIAVLLATLIGRSIRLADQRVRDVARPRLPMQESGPADDTVAPRLEAVPRSRTHLLAARRAHHFPHGGTAGGRTRRSSRK